jgi:hypothetical protein
MSKPSDNDIRATVRVLLTVAPPKMRTVMLAQMMQITAQQGGVSEEDMLAGAMTLVSVLNSKLTVAQRAVAESMVPPAAEVAEAFSKAPVPPVAE